MFVVVALGIAGLVAALIAAAAVSDYRVAATAYRQLARHGSNDPAPWWYVGSRVKLTLLAGVVCSMSGVALLLGDGLVRPVRVVGAAALAVGALLLAAGELTRHRLMRRTTTLHPECPPIRVDSVRSGCKPRSDG